MLFHRNLDVMLWTAATTLALVIVLLALPMKQPAQVDDKGLINQQAGGIVRAVPPRNLPGPVPPARLGHRQTFFRPCDN